MLLYIDTSLDDFTISVINTKKNNKNFKNHEYCFFFFWNLSFVL